MAVLNPKRVTRTMLSMGAKVQEDAFSGVVQAIAQGFKISKAGDDWSEGLNAYYLELTRFPVASPNGFSNDIVYTIVDFVSAFVKVAKVFFYVEFAS